LLRSQPRPSRVREALHDLIMESLPAFPVVPVPPPVEDVEVVTKKVAIEDDVVVLKPIVVVESHGVRALARLIAREKSQEEEEKFSVIEGGTLYRKGRLRLGAWAGEQGLDLVKFGF
jgi:hypothetical protein